jgi:hypothetical protein
MHQGTDSLRHFETLDCMGHGQVPGKSTDKDKAGMVQREEAYGLIYKVHAFVHVDIGLKWSK